MELLHLVKALLLSSTLLLCQVTSAGKTGFLGFEPNKVYTYTYEATMSTGASYADGARNAGTTLTAILQIQKQTRQRALFKLSGVMRGRLNGTTFEEERNTERSSERDEHDKYMEEGFRVSRADGMIATIYFNDPKRSPMETINWRTAIAELFQGDFERLIKQRSSGNMEYESQEAGMGGICATSYSGTYEEASEVLQVHKIRHYDRCQLRPHFFHSSIRGSSCGNKEHKPFQAKAQVLYRIKAPENAGMIIEEISGTGEISLRPFGDAGQTIKSVVTQNLKLKSVEMGTIPQPEHRKFLARTVFRYVYCLEDRNARNIPFDDLKKAHYYDRYDRKTRSPDFSKVLRDFPSQQSDERMLHEQILTLIDNFKMFSYDHFVRFFDNHIDVHTLNFRRQVAFQVLPLVGTNPSILFILDRTEDGTMHPLLAADYISTIPFHVKEPSSALIQAFWNFLHKDAVNSHELLYTTSWLAFGSLLHRGCVKGDFASPSTNFETFIDEDVCTSYLKKIIKSFHDETIPERQALLLRAIKNSRLPGVQTNSFLQDIIDGEYKPLLKREAIFAVFEVYGNHPTIMARDSPQRLLKSIENIFLDKSQDSVVRMAAFEVIAKTVTSQEKAEKIVFNWLAEEQNQNIAGFMYSTLEYLVNSTAPCDLVFSSLYGDAMRSVAPISGDPLKQGFNKYYTYFTENYNFGHTTHAQLIPSNDSVIPLGLSYRHTMTLMGYSVDKVEMGNFLSDTAFLNKKLLELLAPDVVDSNSNGIPPWKHLKNVKLPQETKSGEAGLSIARYAQDVLVLYWYRLLETFAGQAPEETVEQKLYGYSPYVKKTQLKFNLFYDEVEYSVPNELGIPVVLSMAVPSNYLNDMSLKNYFTTGNLEVKWNTGFATGVRSSMSVQSSYSPHGFRLDTIATSSLPLNIDIDLRGMSLTLQPVLPYDALTFHTTPSVFYDHQYTEIEIKEPFKYENKIGHDYFGIGATINAAVDRNWPDTILYRVINDIATSDGDINTLHEAALTFQTILFLNPSARSMSFNVRVEQHSKNPTTRFKFDSFYMDKTSLRDFKVGFRSETAPTHRQWNMELKAFSDDTPSKKISHRAFSLSRGPIPDYDLNEFELCLDIDSNYEKMSLAILEPLSRKVNPQFLFNARLVYGLTCKAETATSISIKGTGKVGQKSNNVFDNTTRIYKERCQENTKLHDIEYCIMETAKSAFLNEFNAEVKYANIARNPQDKFVRSWIAMGVDCNLEDDEELAANPIEDGQVTLFAKRLEDSKFVQFSVARPENETMLDVALSFNELLNCNEIESSENIGRFNKDLFDSHRATCYFTTDHFDTFDEVQYKYKLEEDKYLMVMTHCPTQNFAIRIHSSTNNGIEMVINVGVQEITLTPLLRQMTLRAPQRQEHHDRITLPYLRRLLKQQKECNSTFCSIHNSKGKLLVTVEKTDDSTGYYINSEPFKLDMFFNGKVGAISTSDLYKGSLCGLCGQFDGEKQDEFMGPDRTVYTSAQSFVESYVTGA